MAPASEESFQEARFSLEDAEYDAVELCAAVEEAALARASNGSVSTSTSTSTSTSSSSSSSSKRDVSNEEILYCTAVLREAVAVFEPEGKVKRRARRNGGRSGSSGSSRSSNLNFDSGTYSVLLLFRPFLSGVSVFVSLSLIHLLLPSCIF
jgi:hypothetical protein